VPDARALELIAEKETIYRDAFTKEFREVAGFAAFAAQARARGLKIAVATAGDKHNIAFALRHLKLAHARRHRRRRRGPARQARARPLPRSGAARGHAAGRMHRVRGRALRHRGGRPRRHARRGDLHHPHGPAELAGPHVIAQVRDFEQLMTTNFLENLHA
jgi:hypothetical protein